MVMAAILVPVQSEAYTGKVVDASTGKPLTGAIITVSGTSFRTQKDGSFNIDLAGDYLAVRAYGYLRGKVLAPKSELDPLEIRLSPFWPKAVYLSLAGVGYSPKREAVLRLADETQMNAVVIDVKDDSGRLSLRRKRTRAGEWDLPSINRISRLLKRLHEQNLYVVARIAVFKDDLLARTRPELALKSDGDSIVQENDRLRWTDPRNEEVWNYNIAIAHEAARLGFDEIQFDYLRFPALRRLLNTEGYTGQVRRTAIHEFLARAREALKPFNVFIAVDVFGYVCWNRDDSEIGQQLEDIISEADYICPMLYPSSFKSGIPASRMPLDHPEKIVYLSLMEAQRRTGVDPIRFRPWLQAFTDNTFDHRRFRAQEIGAQVEAAKSFGSDGWMLWNSRNVYSEEDLPQ
jgi:hypothetical protein